MTSLDFEGAENMHVHKFAIVSRIYTEEECEEAEDVLYGGEDIEAATPLQADWPNPFSQSPPSRRSSNV